MIPSCGLLLLQGDLPKVAATNARAECKAMMKKDLGWFRRVQAANYFEIDPKGVRKRRSQAMASRTMIFENGRFKDLKFKVVNVQPLRGGMRVTFDVSGIAVVEPKGAPEPFPLDVTFRYQETWSQTGGQWSLHSQRSLRETMHPRLHVIGKE